jgi:hypothetical protein
MKATIENILGTVNNTKQHLAKIEASLFEVVKVPLGPIDMPKFFKAPKESFGTYKSNGGEALGVVGKNNLPMQPKEFMDNIIATVHEFGADLDLETLTFREYCEGSKIEFSIRMKPFTFINAKKVVEETNLEVISLYTERVVCTNGMVASKLQGTLKGRNTLGGKTKILSYAKELAEIINGANSFKEKMEALDKIKVTKQQIEAFKKSLLGYNAASLAESDKNESKREGILESVEKAIEIEFARTGQTAFGLLQGITYYTNHFANSGTKNTKKVITDAEYIRFNQGFKTNEKAQELLFALVEN